MEFNFDAFLNINGQNALLKTSLYFVENIGTGDVASCLHVQCDI
jgi:hypothetical protein